MTKTEALEHLQNCSNFMRDYSCVGAAEGQEHDRMTAEALAVLTREVAS